MKKSKKVKTIVIKDYRPMIVDYLYNRKKITKSDSIIKKYDCYSLNHLARNRNIFKFNKILHESIIHFIKRKNILTNDIKLLLGADVHDMNSIFNESKIDRNMNFKFVYDVCQALDISMAELVEKMESKFTIDN